MNLRQTFHKIHIVETGELHSSLTVRLTDYMMILSTQRYFKNISLIWILPDENPSQNIELSSSAFKIFTIY